jgi:glutathione S-transferase|eukprot:Transcript_16446.p1 GENE.Transcript_16446~~Transcript_16446.p1  ORF type:complete len:236 (-),score=80.84 Transcript_16446:131-838(-)
MLTRPGSMTRQIRGLGAPLRMLLAYSGVEHELVFHKETEDSSWFEVKKPELQKKNALANLPYLEVDDGSLVVCESNVCLMYLQNSLGLGPETDVGRLQSYALLSMYMCTRNDMVNRAYFEDVLSPPPCPTREAFDESMKALLASGPFSKYESCLKLSGTPFFCGDTPCACDFAIWEMLDQYTKVASDLGEPPPLARVPLCAAFHQRLRALPELASYFESPAYALPCNSPALTHWN